ncbi:Na+/H+ antiporter subunit D [Thermosipho ferrireducens]|uniref:Na+/H+ antiporter subunit D n=1 Tax=Thermosipho ferrireducens TaxID=2571116 RepID=A0ABX7S8U4_9BACT|nr:proton-conducting transporter membrane subunit [Thermosipho ferrireducens]QTA38057.1 Na+/H+ antiporter subunit D [Thermosipho ferrireducens]
MIALLISIPLIAAFLTVPFKGLGKYLLLPVTIINLIILTSLNPVIISNMGGWKAPFGITLILDGASYFSLIVLNTIFLIISLLPQIIDKGFGTVLLLLLTSTSGLILTGDIFNSFVFLEITAAAAYILGSNKQNFYGAYKYLILGSLAGGFYLLGAIFAYLGTGSLNIADISVNLKENFLPAVSLLLLIGLGVEAKLFPLSGWVPDVYSSGSALTPTILGTGVTFTFIYMIGRIFITMLHGKFMGILYILGLLTIVFGELAAFREKKLLRALAYSSIAQTGIMLTALSINSFDSLVATYFHALNDATAKIVLFLIAAYTAKGFSRNKTSGIAFSIASFSLIGFPLFAGFRSKMMILFSSFSSGDYLFPAIFLFAGVIEAVYIIRWNINLWHNNDVSNVTIPWNVKLITLILALALIYIGLFPEIYINIARSIADSIVNTANYVSSVLGGM